MPIHDKRESKRKTEEELAGSLKKLRQLESIINRSPVVYCIWKFDASASVEYISANIEQWGYAPEDFLSGRVSWYGITHPDDVVRLKEDIRANVAKRRWQFDQTYRILDRQGNIRWVEDRTILIFGQKQTITHAQGSIMDVTQQKTAETEQRKSEERLHELLAGSSDIVTILDEQGVFQYVSSSVKRILDYAQEDLIGRNYLEYVHPEDASLLLKAFQEVLKNQHRKIPTEFRIRNAGGEWTYLEALGNNCLDHPAINGIIIDARDISERKRLEEKLAHAQKMEAIGRLAGGIAHDFNNILMGIQGYVSLLLLKMDALHPDVEKMINIQTLVQSGADLTGKLLGFARGGRYELKPTDINALMAKTINLFSRTKKEITVHQKYERTPWTVEVDRGQIEQVLLNLLVNAWQAMPQGGDIYAETQNISIARSSGPVNLKPGDYLKITITDTGTGMDKNTLQRIFEPFFTTREKQRGVGLGLASAFGIIKEHGGIISAASEPGRGTTFTLYLPSSDKAIPREVHTAKTVLTGSETILLVDDEASIVEVCRDILISLGYKIFTAESGQEAVMIYALNKDKIDMIVLDMIMPGMNGAETYKRITSLHPQARVLLSTGYSGSDQAQKILDMGCSGLIQKPFRIEDLSQKIREVLDAPSKT